MKRTLSLTVILLCLVSLVCAQKKIALKVLYVGGSSDYTSYEGENEDAQHAEDVRLRTEAFTSLLGKYFDKVDAIDASEYTQEKSYDYDVTILDGAPKPLQSRKVYYDDKGNYKSMDAPLYFTEDFDRPVITIAELGETVGRGIGLKTDWYCLCLDADAHHLNTKHPIFKGPFKVKLTMRKQPTPESAFEYAYFIDYTIPKEIPMWKVQTKGYIHDKGVRIGMVSRPWGFTDSPDAEYISSGVCAKTIDAVAIGRHANFLHWGFAASPRYMTDEAKTVFANAVVYISKYAGHKPIARKYNDRIATREYLKEKKYLATQKAYEDRLASDSVWAAMMLKNKAAAEDKKAKGEQLNDEEKSLLGYTPAPKTTRESFVKRYQKELYDKFGTDEKAYIDYYDTNKPYFYGGKGLYVITVDEDAKSLSTPNNDKRLLDKAIALWEKGADPAKAKRILYRYTLCRFTTPKEWREWYDRYQDRLFFTEAGGWLFMVNSEEKNVPGNDYSVLKAEEAAERLPQVTGEPTDTDPVMLSGGIETVRGGGTQLVIRAKIRDGYHIYAYVSPKDPFIKTTFEILPESTYKAAGNMILPGASVLNSNGTTTYEGDILFRQNLTGKGPGTVKVKVAYQCCDTHVCLMPQEKVLTIAVK